MSQPLAAVEMSFRRSRRCARISQSKCVRSAILSTLVSKRQSTQQVVLIGLISASVEVQQTASGPAHRLSKTGHSVEKISPEPLLQGPAKALAGCAKATPDQPVDAFAFQPKRFVQLPSGLRALLRLLSRVAPFPIGRIRTSLFCPRATFVGRFQD